MEACYDGNLALEMPRSYVPVSQDEMEYVEGGVNTRYKGSITFTAALLQAVYCAGVGVAVGIITTAICGGLGVTGVGAFAIPAVIGFATSIIASYATRNATSKTINVDTTVWTPTNYDQYWFGNVRIGW